MSGTDLEKQSVRLSRQLCGVGTEIVLRTYKLIVKVALKLATCIVWAGLRLVKLCADAA